MSDNRKKMSLKKEATLLTISKMANLVITMATSMLLSRFRTLEEYGTYSQLDLVLNLLTTLFLLGIPNAINFFYPRADTNDERKIFLQTFFSINTILSVIAGLAMIFSLPLLVIYFKNEKLYQFVYFMVLMPWAKITIQERGNLFVAANKTRTLIKHTLANSVALLGIIILTKICNQSFGFYMILYVLVELGFGLIVYIEAKKLTGSLAFKIDRLLLKKILIYSIPIGISDMVSIPTRRSRST